MRKRLYFDLIKPFEEMAAKDKQRYQREMESYVPGSKATSPKPKKTKESSSKPKEAGKTKEVKEVKDVPMSAEFVDSDQDF
jgi:hypothetical protein